MAKRSPYLVRRPTKQLDDDHLLQAILEPLSRSVDLQGSYEELRAALDVATPGQVAVFAVRRCDREIVNGGFQQLLVNSTGVLFHEAVHGLRLIGATDYARFFSEAAALLPSAQFRELRTRTRGCP